MKSAYFALFAFLALVSSVTARGKKPLRNYPKPTEQSPYFTFDELYNMTTGFFDNFMYPNNAVQAKLINSTLFAEDVLGRVDVTRNFNGRELNTEYAFGLFANIALNPNSFTLLGVPTDYEIIHFAANQNVIALSLIIDFNITALGIVSPVEVVFWATVNSQGQVSQYDATFRYLSWQFASMVTLGQEKYNVSTPAEVETKLASSLATSICGVAQTYCVGANQQYNSTTECYNFLTEEVRFGEAFELGRNTLLCRMVHQNMVPFRPEVHCSHIGRSGGGYCVDDMTYNQVVRQDIYFNTPFVPYGYGSTNATIAEQ